MCGAAVVEEAAFSCAGSSSPATRAHNNKAYVAQEEYCCCANMKVVKTFKDQDEEGYIVEGQKEAATWRFFKSSSCPFSIFIAVFGEARKRPRCRK